MFSCEVDRFDVAEVLSQSTLQCRSSRLPVSSWMTDWSMAPSKPTARFQVPAINPWRYQTQSSS